MRAVEKSVRDAWLNFANAAIPEEAHKSQREAMEYAYFCGGMAVFSLLVKASAPGREDDPSGVSKIYNELRKWGRNHSRELS